MPWRIPARERCLPRRGTSRKRGFASTATKLAFTQVYKLQSWDVDRFRQEVFSRQIPAHLPPDASTTSTTVLRRDWFTHRRKEVGEDFPAAPALNRDYWSKYEDVVVPLEFTETLTNGSSSFRRFQAPMKVFLDWNRQTTDKSSRRLYLAQCQLVDLPNTLRVDLPTPEIVLKAGKGDVYDANLWMGLAPTYTPLHRDPNPNIFLQLAGRKVVRLYPPDVGAAIFTTVQEKLKTSTSIVFRGEEMMQGEEKEILELEVWQKKDSSLGREGYEAVLEQDEALFIPRGWWHSIKGIGTGITASVNWWFR